MSVGQYHTSQKLFFLGRVLSFFFSRRDHTKICTSQLRLSTQDLVFINFTNLTSPPMVIFAYYSYKDQQKNTKIMKFEFFVADFVEILATSDLHPIVSTSLWKVIEPYMVFHHRFPDFSPEITSFLTRKGTSTIEILFFFHANLNLLIEKTYN